MSKHTPGPWHQAEHHPDLVYAGASRDSDPLAPMIARADWGGMRFSEEVIAANARLIAAAPDLLAVAERVAALKPPLSALDLAGLVVAARDAIAKAEGGP